MLLQQLLCTWPNRFYNHLCRIKAKANFKFSLQLSDNKPEDFEHPPQVCERIRSGKINSCCGFHCEQSCLQSCKITSGERKWVFQSRPKLPQRWTKLSVCDLTSSSVPTKPKHVSQLLRDYKNITSESELVGECEKETEQAFTTPVDS